MRHVHASICVCESVRMCMCVFVCVWRVGGRGV